MPSNRQRIWIAAGTLAVVVVLLNMALHYGGRASQRRHMLTILNSLPSDADVVFLGNSLVEAGCDSEAFKAAWSGRTIKPVNIALGDTSPVEHCLILNEAFRHPLHPKYIVYGFFDDQLNVAPSGDLELLVGNRALSYYFPKEAAQLYSPGSRFKEWELRLVGSIPMYSERSSLWAKVEKLRRRLEDIGMPPKQTNRYGRVDDFAGLEAKDVHSFQRRCDLVMAQGASFSLPIRKIVNLAKEHGAQLILVEMPMPSRHRHSFYSLPKWLKLRQELMALAQKQGLFYLAACDWVDDGGNFEDATHLNEQGARIFSARLATAMAGLEPQAKPLAAGTELSRLSK